MNSVDEEVLPVLNDVVESGNESIIQSSRLGREVQRELDVLQQSSPLKYVLPQHIVEDEEEEEGLHGLIANIGTTAQNPPDTTDNDQIENMIDELIDRHITELRRDIRRLLIRVKQNN